MYSGILISSRAVLVSVTGHEIPFGFENYGRSSQAMVDDKVIVCVTGNNMKFLVAVLSHSS